MIGMDKITPQPVADQLELRVIALGVFEELEKVIALLADRLCNQDADLPAYCAELPYRRQDETPPAVIEPRTMLRAEAREAAAAMLRSLRSLEDQDAATVRRLPGLIAASAETMALVVQVNEKKYEFEKAVAKIAEGRQVRRRQMLRVVKRINLMQCYRAIKILPERPAAVSFSWARSSGASQPMTVKKAIARVTAARLNPPMDIADEKRWNSTVDITLERLARLPEDEVVAFRETVAPHPRANIFPVEGEKIMRNLSLPMFYPQVEDAEIPPVTPLGTLDMRLPAVRRRRSKYETEPLSGAFGIYRIREEERGSQ
jgi:hypothetical protein